MTAILFFVITLGASVIGAVSGIGGGIIIKPVLELVSGETVDAIVFLSGCTVLSMAIVSLLRRRSSMADFELRRGTMLAIGSAVGGILGKMIFDELRARFGSATVGVCQSIVLALMALGLIAYVARRSKIQPRDVKGNLACAALGMAMGLVSAFLGIGGGPLNLAVLFYFLSMDNKRASIHSIYIILFSQAASLILTFARGKVPAVSPLTLALVILGGVSGALIGSVIVKRISNRALGYLFSAILVFVFLTALANLLGYLGVI